LDNFTAFEKALKAGVTAHIKELPHLARSIIKSDGIDASFKSLLHRPQPKEKSKNKDPRPLQSQFELLCRGQGQDCRILTPFVTNGNTDSNPAEFINVWGSLEPAVRFTRIFYGSHGKTPFIASCKGTVIEAKYTQQVQRGVPTRRMLGANTAPAVPAFKPKAQNSGTSNDDDSGSDEDPLSRVQKAPANPVKSRIVKASSTKPMSPAADPVAPPRIVKKIQKKPVNDDDDDVVDVVDDAPATRIRKQK
jgi:hypothetical protein